MKIFSSHDKKREKVKIFSFFYGDRYFGFFLHFHLYRIILNSSKISGEFLRFSIHSRPISQIFQKKVQSNEENK